MVVVSEASERRHIDRLVGRIPTGSFNVQPRKQNKKTHERTLVEALQTRVAETQNQRRVNRSRLHNNPREAKLHAPSTRLLLEDVVDESRLSGPEEPCHHSHLVHHNISSHTRGTA